MNSQRIDRLDKEGLEREKLLLEIRELGRPWWSKFGSYAAILPSLIGLTALGITIWTGYFGTEKARLANEKAALILQADSLFAHANDLSATVDTLRRSKDSLELRESELLRQLEVQRKKISFNRSLLEKVVPIMREAAAWADSVDRYRTQLGGFTRDQTSNPEYVRLRTHMQTLLLHGVQIAEELKRASQAGSRLP